MKKVLVYPCGTEIGLEIYRSLCSSPHYKVYGGSSTYDHGRFLYKNHIDHLPMIKDDSREELILEFNQAIKKYGFDFIYPAMDGVLTVFSKYRGLLEPVVIAPEKKTAEITRSKRKTYQLFRGILPVPEIYETVEEVVHYPVFIKPDVGQGAVGTAEIHNREELLALKKRDKSQLILELLPGKEYTVDCFTNGEGELVYYRGRERKRIKGGISVNAVFCSHKEFGRFANMINEKLNQKGAWFFQVKEDENGKLKLLEIASRPAGTSAITRCAGVNLPLLSINVFDGIEIRDVIVNGYSIEADRALGNCYKTKIAYSTVYIDYDDTVVLNGRLNLQVIKFLYQCVDRKKKIVLLSKHTGNLEEELKKFRLQYLFDEVIQIGKPEKKSHYIKETDAIFIDDSYGERKEVREQHGIFVFDTHMVGCLLGEE